MENKIKNVLKNPWVYITLALTIIVVVEYKDISAQPGQYDDFAKCLAEKELKMYGTEWCPHCKNQKALFGKSFKYIDYTDCDYEKDICNSEGITGYPTWKINGQSYPGEQTFQKFSELTGCEINGKENI